MKTIYELEQENARLIRACRVQQDYELKISKLNHENYELKEKINDLEMQLEGYVRCENCEGYGEWMHPKSGHPQGPNYIGIHCMECDGEGYVKKED